LFFQLHSKFTVVLNWFYHLYVLNLSRFCDYDINPFFSIEFVLFCFSFSVLSPSIKSNENKEWGTISHWTCPQTFFILLFGDFCERGGRDKRKDFFSRFLSFPPLLASTLLHQRPINPPRFLFWNARSTN